MHLIFEPGLFSESDVRTAAIIGAVAGILGAVVGVYTVVRSQSFAGHALTDVATTGGAAAFFYGLNPLALFVGANIAGAGAMDLIGVQRVRSRDLATGIVLGAATGLSALFLYLDTQSSAVTGVSQTVLFGSIFTVDRSLVAPVCVLAAVTLVVLAAVHRPLLLHSLSPELASARGIRAHVVGLAFMAALAISVGLSAIMIGSILSTALLIGPAATALRLTTSVRAALIAAAVIGVATAWLGILLAFDSYYWDPSNRALPVSFFIVAISFLSYLGSGIPAVQSVARRLSRVAPRAMAAH